MLSMPDKKVDNDGIWPIKLCISILFKFEHNLYRWNYIFNMLLKSSNNIPWCIFCENNFLANITWQTNLLVGVGR